MKITAPAARHHRPGPFMAESTGGRRKRYLFNIVDGKPVDVFHAGIVFRAGTYTGRPGYEQVDPPKALIAAVCAIL